MTGPGIRSACFCTWVLLLSLFAHPAGGEEQTAGEQPGAAQESDVLLRAMRDELVRSADTLRLEELERPYFIEYAVVDTRSTVLEATFGASVRSDRTHARSLRVDVRVGSHELDNSEFVAVPSFFQFGGFFPRSLVREDDYDALRHDLWLATDAAYKEALEQLARKRAFLQNRVRDEPTPDLSVEGASVLVEPLAQSPVDVEAWQERVRALSEVFREYPAIDESGVTLRVEESNKYLVNSDGSVVRQPATLAVLHARAATRAPDGMRLKHFVPFYERDVDDLPAEGEMEAAVRGIASELTALAAAPVLEAYYGPVLVSGQASPELFGQLLGEQLSGHRPPLLEDERMAAMMPRSGLANRLNRRVLPASFDVMDDPTQAAFAGESLIGSYALDDQGVRSQPVALIEGGVLKTLLMSRRPRREIPQSNGHARAGAFGPATAQPGNLFVRAGSGLSDRELKEELIDMARDAGLDHGLLIRVLDDPGITGSDPSSSSSIMLLMQGGRPASQLTSPILAYKVYVEDGREELVRGLGFRDVSVRSLRDIVASGEDQYVGNRLLRPGAGGMFQTMGVFMSPAFGGPLGQGIPSAVVAPPVLFEELEMERIGGPQQTRIVIEHPYFAQERQ